MTAAVVTLFQSGDDAIITETPQQVGPDLHRPGAMESFAGFVEKYPYIGRNPHKEGGGFGHVVLL